MKETFIVSENKYDITVSAEKIGNDYQISIYGGDCPHIGSVSVSVSRNSLLCEEEFSSTTSTINMIGHKDNYIADAISSYLCNKLKSTVVCVCGIHIENASKDAIEEILSLIPAIQNKLISICS